MVVKRTNLPADTMVEDFLSHTAEEEPKLYKRLRALDAEGLANLAGILGRFDSRNKHQLDAHQRLFARRILIRLHKPSTAGLATTNLILDYLDLNANALLEEDELDLCIEVLEIFARAESDNNTLSTRELKMLYAVLRQFDSDDSKALEAHERAALRRALDDPDTFLAEQQRSNPYFQQALDAEI